MAKFDVGAFSFESKKQAKALEQDIRGRHKPKARGKTDVVILEGVELEFIASLLERHPDVASKVANGIEAIAVRWSSINHTQTQYVIVDGSYAIVPFSINICLNGKPQTPEVTFRKALRWEVRDQIQAFKTAKTQNGQAVCAITGDTHPIAEMVVDHFPPFEDVVQAYLGGRDFRTISLVPDPQQPSMMVIADPEERKDWRFAHGITVDHGGLRIAHRIANASGGRWVI